MEMVFYYIGVMVTLVVAGSALWFATNLLRTSILESDDEFETWPMKLILPESSSASVKIEFCCPQCHQLLWINLKKVGHEVSCPYCKYTIQWHLMLETRINTWKD